MKIWLFFLLQSVYLFLTWSSKFGLSFYCLYLSQSLDVDDSKSIINKSWHVQNFDTILMWSSKSLATTSPLGKRKLKSQKTHF